MKKNTPAKKSKNETFTCFLCLKSYNTSYNALKSHAMFTHKKKGQDGYVCENEDCQFKNKYKNSNHQCNGQEIWHKEKIDLHKQKKTEYVEKDNSPKIDPKKKIFECSNVNCLKRFTTKKAAKSHQMTSCKFKVGSEKGLDEGASSYGKNFHF